MQTMKINAPILKCLHKCVLALGLFLAATNIAHAYTGWCSTDSGTPFQYHYNFGNVTVLDVNKNVKGFLFPKAFQWQLGATYMATCDCDPVQEAESKTQPHNYYSTTTRLQQGHTDGAYQFLKLNEYLEIGLDVWVGGTRQAYVPVPWVNVDNMIGTTGNNYQYKCKGSTLTDRAVFSTGSMGRMKIYINKPFVGTTFIQNVEVIDIYGSTISGSYGGTPMSSVYISGAVTAPQNCEINAGQMVTVDFGKIWAGDFTTKGQRPNNTTPKNISVPLKCNNIAAFANLTLRIESEPSAETPEAIKSNNPDVGVEILDNNGKLLLPNTGLVPFSINENFEATVTFKAVPVSTTGNTPASGLFQAQAYIRIDFA